MDTQKRKLLIRQFLLESAAASSDQLVARACVEFGISRQAVHKHLSELVAAQALRAEGQTKARKYSLKPLAEFSGTLLLDGLQEDRPWQDEIKPRIEALPQNVQRIVAYGFTEMLNNAIDHSGSADVQIDLLHTAVSVRLRITDQGVGIFRKIRESFHLAEDREAILELSKGKLTTDPQRHSGEGIFFTSRMMDVFVIRSGQLLFTHVRPDDDWLIESDQATRTGTQVEMVVSTRSSLEIKSLFDQFATTDDLSFSRTHVPIRLAQYAKDDLISRSQARRVLTRFHRFQEVLLDFSGVDFIGQAFADEIFRVFRSEHPEVRLVSTHANTYVSGMIHRAELLLAHQSQ